MKKLLYVICLMVIVVTGCEDRHEARLAERRAGTYWGEFNTLRSNEATGIDTLMEVKLTQSHVDPECLMMNGFELEPEDGVYEYDSDAVTATEWQQVCELCGIPADYLSETPRRLSIEVKFYSANMTIYIMYRGEEDALGRTQFTGTRR